MKRYNAPFNSPGAYTVLWERRVMASPGGRWSGPQSLGYGGFALADSAASRCSGAACYRVEVRATLNNVYYGNEPTLYACAGTTNYGFTATACSGTWPTIGSSLEAARLVSGNGPPSFGLVLSGPNPAQGPLVLRIAVPEPRHVLVAVHDVLGREVGRLVASELPSGFHDVSLDTAGLSSGTYVVRMVAGDFQETLRVSIGR